MTIFRKLFTQGFFFHSLFIMILFLLGCNDKSTEPDVAASAGRFDLEILVDGDTRKYIVEIPEIYNSRKPLPVVFMFHGTSESGEFMYERSGWVEKGETEGIITAYPTSWKYCFNDRGTIRNTTRFNSYNMASIICEGEKLRDDVKFFQAMVDEISSKWAIDTKRIYVCGFSNGASFTSRLAIEKSDIIAAVVSSSGSLGIASNIPSTPVRKLPVLLLFGNNDSYFVDATGEPLPMENPNTVLDHTYIKTLLAPYISRFSVNDAPIISNLSLAYKYDFNPISQSDSHKFVFTLVRDMGHVFPNGNNAPVNGVNLYWDFFSQYSLQ